MPEILVINPSGRKAGRSNKGKGKTMPKKKGRKKARRNPSAIKRASKLFAGLNFRAALKSLAPMQIGVWAAKWAEKRFGEVASDTDPSTWNYASYIKGALGATVAAVLANMMRPGSGQLVLLGGLNQVTEKLIRNELIERSQWAVGQFGADAEAGMMLDPDGTPYMGYLGEEIPLDESHRMLPEASGYGDTVPVGPLGESLVTPGPLGESDDFRRYARAYQQ